jgi:hypothetical protein
MRAIKLYSSNGTHSDTILFEGSLTLSYKDYVPVNLGGLLWIPVSSNGRKNQSPDCHGRAEHCERSDFGGGLKDEAKHGLIPVFSICSSLFIGCSV